MQVSQLVFVETDAKEVLDALHWLRHLAQVDLEWTQNMAECIEEGGLAIEVGRVYRHSDGDQHLPICITLRDDIRDEMVQRGFTAKPASTGNR